MWGMGTTESTSSSILRMRPRRWFVVTVGAMLAVVLVAFVISNVVEQRARDRGTDRFYCTLSGVGPLDRAPNTGERCIDLQD